MTLKSRT